MNPQRYDLIASIFADVRHRPAEERAAALARLCGDDLELRNEVEVYLRSDSGDGPSVLSKPVVEDPELIRSLLNTDEEELPPGSRIGMFTIIRRIAEGGFGVVYLADQSGPIRRQVALKVIKPGMDSRAVIARFEQERQALAVMDHPNVATVYEGGVTDRGRPYFVMEYVAGEPITEYCDRCGLRIAERLRLFRQVCGAVQHAHLRGIIHRDLKPSNILVAEKDGRPVPKVIDFGVAKAVNHTLTDITVFTVTGQIIGTPEYMSPEQTQIGCIDIDSRTDVYSLGVVLYELLAGHVPFDPRRLRAAGYAELQRIIREVEPPRPSTKLSGLGPAAAQIALRRRTGADELAKLLLRELEWIPLQAIRKDRDQRYATPMDLSRDIGRYLSGDALEAGPESPLYRFRKTVHKHRLPLAAAAAVFTALMAGTGTTLWKAQVADREKAAAQRAQHRAEAIVQFVTDALRSADPQTEGGKQDISVVEAMRNAVRSLDAASLAADPQTESEIQTVIGSILQNNGHATEALPLFEAALATRRRLHQGDDHTISTSLNNLAAVYQELGRIADAETLLREALAMDRRLTSGDHPQIASSIGNLAGIVLDRGDAEEALSLFRESLAMYRRLYAGDHPDVALAMNNVGFALGHLDRFGDAEPVFQDVLGMYQRLHPSDHPDVARSLNNLAFTRQELGRSAEAEPLYEQALAMRQRLYHGDHPDVAESLNNMGYVWEDLGRLSEAAPMYRAALEMYQRIYPGDHPRVAVCISKLADISLSLGDPESAELLYRQALDMRRRILPADHPDVALSLSGLAWCQLRLRKVDDAEQSAGLAVDMYARLFPGGSSDRGVALGVQACIAHARGREAEAQSLISEAERMVVASDGPDGPAMRRIAEARSLMQSR